MVIFQTCLKAPTWSQVASLFVTLCGPGCNSLQEDGTEDENAARAS